MKRAFSLLEALVTAAVLGSIAAFLLPMFARYRTQCGPRSICSSNLKQIGLGFIMYKEDADGLFPPVARVTTWGWADVLFPYVKSQQVYQCNKAPAGLMGAFSTDYFYNGRLSRLRSSKVKNPSRTLLFGDGDDNASTANSWTGLPAEAMTDSNSPAQRHNKGAFYCYVDGHVKFVVPQSLPLQAHWNPLLP